MSPLRLLAGALVAICAMTAPSRAAGTVVPAPLVTSLLSWVEARMGQSGLTPPVVVANRDVLRQMNGIRHLAQYNEEVKAAYVPGLVFLDHTTWRADSVFEKSYLVHELVHHVQILRGDTPACPEALEAEAYRLQNEWLAEQGRPPLYSEGWIVRKSACVG